VPSSPAGEGSPSETWNAGDLVVAVVLEAGVFEGGEAGIYGCQRITALREEADGFHAAIGVVGGQVDYETRVEGVLLAAQALVAILHEERLVFRQEGDVVEGGVADVGEVGEPDLARDCRRCGLLERKDRAEAAPRARRRTLIVMGVIRVRSLLQRPRFRRGI
jgi:hypothetical protein